MKSTSSPSRSKVTISVPFATSRFSLIFARIGRSLELPRSRVRGLPLVDRAVDLEDCRLETADEVVGDALRIRPRLRPDPELLAAARDRGALLELSDVTAGVTIEPRGDANLATVSRLDAQDVGPGLVDREDPVES